MTQTTPPTAREAVARIVSPSAMKTRETMREEWIAWMAETHFGDGPNQPDKPKLLEQLIEQEWEELATRRCRALAKADRIIALNLLPSAKVRETLEPFAKPADDPQYEDEEAGPRFSMDAHRAARAALDEVAE